MKKILMLIFLVIWLMTSYCVDNLPLEGNWRVSYFNNEATTRLKFFFNDFDLYNPPEYAPQIQITGDSIEYALGIGSNYSREAYRYLLTGKNILTIQQANNKQPFNLKFVTKDSFCLLNENDVIGCFTKIDDIDTCHDYSLTLRITSEYYVHNLSIQDDGHFTLIRRGVKSDSISQMLSSFEHQKIGILIGMVNTEELIGMHQNIGGDYTEYELALRCGNRFMNKKILGLRDIPFGIKALLVNLEKLSKEEFMNDSR